MSSAQINARVDSNIKHEVDVLLARLGMSTTDIIRALWSYLAREQALPEFMQDQEDHAQAASNAQPYDGAGMAVAMAKDLNLAYRLRDVDYDQLRDQAFEELVEEGVFHA